MSDSRLTVASNPEPSGSITMGDPLGNEDVKVGSETDLSSALQFDTTSSSPKDTESGDNDKPSADAGGEEQGAKDGDVTETSDDTGEGDEQDGNTDEVALTDEQSAEIAGRITDSETGQLNEDALTKEFFDNEGKGLNDETYQYLADSHNISKDMAKNIENALVTQRNATTDSSNQALFDVAGGTDKLQAAIAWGKDYGYSESDQKRFNSVLDGSDEAAKADAVSALMHRYNAANPPKEATTPKRDITDGATQVTTSTPKVTPFETRADYRVAMHKAEGNQSLMEQVAQRLHVSRF